VHTHSRHIHRVGQNHIYTPYMTVYLMISLPNIPYIHGIYMVLANPTHTPQPCAISPAIVCLNSKCIHPCNFAGERVNAVSAGTDATVSCYAVNSTRMNKKDSRSRDETEEGPVRVSCGQFNKNEQEAQQKQ